MLDDPVGLPDRSLPSSNPRGIFGFCLRVMKHGDAVLGRLGWQNARLGLLLIAFCGVAFEVARIITNPRIPLLPPHREGHWLRVNRAWTLTIHTETQTSGSFRKRFVLQAPRDISILLTAYRKASVFLDGTSVPTPVSSSWKRPIPLVLPSRVLNPGEHELQLTVENTMAPPLFHLASNLTDLERVEGWESTQDGVHWLPAVRADQDRAPGIQTMFPSLGQGIFKCLPVLALLFFGTWWLTTVGHRFANSISAPETVKLLLLAGWAILGINNGLRLDITRGFDGENHFEYISYILQNHRLPTAADGLQMFQPPLYYLLQAVVFGLGQLIAPSSMARLALNLLPLACALLLVEISYRLLRELFPDREDLQSFGLLVAGLLPMNLYMCQFLGNEPLAAVFTGLALLTTIKAFRNSGPAEWIGFVIPGIVCGLAILSKVTPLLLLPVICLFILIAPRTEPTPLRFRIKGAGVIVLCAAMISGWFFVRNSWLFGKPFIGGWDPCRRIVWWQDPGYRLLSDYGFLGQALRQPILAAFNGLADGFYSTLWSDGYLSGNTSFWAKPPWNYSALATTTGLSLGPALLILCGVGLTFWRSTKKEYWPFTFLLVCLGIYFAALFHLHVSLPIYSTAKASYTMGLTPVYGVMAALGAGVFARTKHLKRLLIALLGSWAAMAYYSFLVLS